MAATITASVAIEQTLFAQAERLAQQLNLTQDQLMQAALENFIRNFHSAARLDESEAGSHAQDAPAQPTGGGRGLINQGEIYWVQREGSRDLEPGIPHPHVVLQADVFNHSRLSTVVACALTSNRQRVNMPGTLLLEAGEGNLPRQSVVEVSKVATLAKSELGEYIGTLTQQRVEQILAGMRFLQRSYFTR